MAPAIGQLAPCACPFPSNGKLQDAASAPLAKECTSSGKAWGRKRAPKVGDGHSKPRGGREKKNSTAADASPAVFLLLVNAMLLIVGMFMETNTSILLLAPILVPPAKAYGIDPIHFGAIMLLNLEIGLITPPFAVNLFVACRLGQLSMDKVLKPIMGFIAICIPVLLLTTYIPSISMFLVKLFIR